MSKEEEIVYIPPYSENSDLKRVHMEFPGGMVLSVADDVATIEANKTTLTLERDGNVQIKSRKSVRISGGEIVFSANSIKMKAKKSIELESEAGTMSLKSLEKTEIHSQVGLILESDMYLDIKSSMVDMKGKEMTFVESDGAVSIKGEVVNIN